MRVGENFGLCDHQIIRFYLKLEPKAQINNALVPEFRKANLKGFVGKMNNLNWEYLLQEKICMRCGIYLSFINKFTTQFIPMKKN